MASVVADTHTFIWYLSSPEKLSAAALRAMDEANQAGNRIHISAITLVEVVYLRDRRKLDEQDFGRLRSLLRDPGCHVEVAPIDRSILDDLPRVSGKSVPEMPDRIIAATALKLGLPLVSRDREIGAFLPNVIW